MKFGEYIRNIRTNALQITLDELAKRSGLSKGYISNLENGTRGIPKIETLEKIAKGLEVDYVEMLEKAGYVTLDAETKSLLQTKSILQENERLKEENAKLTEKINKIKDILSTQ